MYANDVLPVPRSAFARLTSGDHLVCCKSTLVSILLPLTRARTLQLKSLVMRLVKQHWPFPINCWSRSPKISPANSLIDLTYSHHPYKCCTVLPELVSMCVCECMCGAARKVLSCPFVALISLCSIVRPIEVPSMCRCRATLHFAIRVELTLDLSSPYD